MSTIHAEHEEAMRAEFFAQAQLARNAYRSDITDAELDRIYRDTAEYDERWFGGPYAEHWAFLSASYDDWQQRPKDMRRFVADVERRRELYGREFGLTDVQYRSLHQARDLACLDHTRAPVDHTQHHPGYERGR
ncbi:hypothetical protein [Nocardia sp. NPDC127526]|uniref:hypothetical protein n=1 Tax=Nocardia sp. NPDC127526 TaxID=3345393 RepID=UPI003626EB15